ncbi:MAG: APC family permease [Actinobacteria bacterium]|nr:APC family permease [Actinomycetota bacterium]
MTDTSPRYAQDLERSLGIRENILITISAVTPASSVFIIVPALIAGLAGGSVLAMLLGGVIALFVGLCYAELASRYPISGAEYPWAARLLGKPIGFATFVLALVMGVLIIAVITSGVGQYLAAVWAPLNSPWTGVVVVIISTTIASLAIKTNAWVTGICLALEVIAIIVLVVLGLTHVSRGADAFFIPQALGDGGVLQQVSFGALFSLIPVALFAYNGYGASVFYSEETKNASKTIGKAIMFSLLVTVVLEVVPLMAVVVGSRSLEALVGSPAPINYFLIDRGGDVINVLVSVAIAVAIFNAVIAIQIQIGRLIFASARDKSWPAAIDRVLGRVNPRTKTPVVATVVVGVLVIIAALVIPFPTLILATGSAVVILYTIVALSALRVRAVKGGHEGGYRMWLWPVPPVIVLVVMAYVVYQTVVADITPLLIALGTLVVGLIWYAAFIRGRKDRWTLPDPQLEELD